MDSPPAPRRDQERVHSASQSLPLPRGVLGGAEQDGCDSEQEGQPCGPIAGRHKCSDGEDDGRLMNGTCAVPVGEVAALCRKRRESLKTGPANAFVENNTYGT